jgi:5-oxoprolinase (ATP-hydrolysing) subunit A
MNSRTIDLNADLGEGYGPYRMGDDAAMLEVVTSANVACGFHAGDPDIMAATFTLAAQRSVAVGAHPGYPDLWGFGRRRMPYSPKEIERLVAYQVGAAQALAAYSGHRVTYVKAHGALGNLSETNTEVARAIARAVRAVDRTLIYLAIARSVMVKEAQEVGLQTRAEIFADRGYSPEGRLLDRSLPGSLLTDPEAAAQRVLEMIRRQGLLTTDGTLLATPIDSVCVHGDSPHAVAMARTLRKRLEHAGLTLAALS